MHLIPYCSTDTSGTILFVHGEIMTNYVAVYMHTLKTEGCELPIDPGLPLLSENNCNTIILNFPGPIHHCCSIHSSKFEVMDATQTVQTNVYTNL